MTFFSEKIGGGCAPGPECSHHHREEDDGGRVAGDGGTVLRSPDRLHGGAGGQGRQVEQAPCRPFLHPQSLKQAIYIL